MVESQWYELRVQGSVGTTAGATSDINDGIALSETGRLCSVSSGQAKKFDSEKDASEFLSKTTLPRIYPFEPVLCRAMSRAETDRGPSSVGLAA